MSDNRPLITAGAENHLGALARADGEVRAHFNLHTGGYTLDAYHRGKGWRAFERAAPTVVLHRAWCAVAFSGWRRYMDSLRPVVDDWGLVVIDPSTGNPCLKGLRNVHAWVHGVLGHPESAEDPADEPWRPARYDPHSASFVEFDSGRALARDRSIEVLLTSRVNPAYSRPSRLRRKRVPRLLPSMFWRPKPSLSLLPATDDPGRTGS